MLTSNRVIGIILILFSAAVWVLASGFPDQAGAGPGSAFFPQALAVLLVILAAGLIFVNPEGEKQDPFNKTQLLTFLGFMLTLIVYILLIPQIGFFVTTVAASFVMVTLLSSSSIVFRGVTAVALSLVTYSVFRFLFNVPLPDGLLF
jgi:putative tricarboxylic transport membrane protein